MSLRLSSELSSPKRVTNAEVEVRTLVQPSPRTQGEIEADACEILRRYSLETIGRGPKEVRAHLLGDLLLVRMSGVLTVSEKHLAEMLEDDGKRLLKKVRSQLMEQASAELEAMIGVCTCASVISLHHDISTITGEEVVLFTLDQPPVLRPTKAK